MFFQKHLNRRGIEKKFHKYKQISYSKFVSIINPFFTNITFCHSFYDRKGFFNPISKLYKAITPDIIEKGVSNFFSNLGDLSVIANEILQLKFDKAASDVSRVLVNSTIGLLGFFDVSSEIGLPKHNEDFGQTLAQWGFSSGPYIVLPFFGPTTLRDLSSLVVDKGALNPMFYIEDDTTKAGLLTLNYVDFKSRSSITHDLIGTASLDEYEFIKNAYFEKRAYEISDGNITDFIEE